MPRALKQPKDQHGLLTLIDTKMVAGRRMATVKCQCGLTKLADYDAVLRGKIKSCGSPCCKQYDRTEFDPEYVPQRPRKMPIAVIRKAWGRYHHPKPRYRLSVAAAAKQYGVNPHTLATTFKSVRRAGGIEKYLKHVM